MTAARGSLYFFNSLPARRRWNDRVPAGGLSGFGSRIFLS